MTPGADRSGLLRLSSLVKPRPEKSAYVWKESLYAPTDMALRAVDGMVSVVSGVGRRKWVERFRALSDGRQKSYCPDMIRLGTSLIFQTPLST